MTPEQQKEYDKWMRCALAYLDPNREIVSNYIDWHRVNPNWIPAMDVMEKTENFNRCVDKAIEIRVLNENLS